MKKIGLVFIGVVLFFGSSFSQMNGLSGENFEEIRELKDSKLYVYIQTLKNEGSITFVGKEAKQDRISTLEYYKEVIHKEWDYCAFEFIDKEKYDLLKKDKNLFFLTNTIKDTKSSGDAPGSRMNKPGNINGKGGASFHTTRYLMLSKGKPTASKFRKKKHLFMVQFSSIHTKSVHINGYYSRTVIRDKSGSLEEFSKNKIESEIKMVNNYLNDCINYNTSEIKIIAKKNAKNLKGKTIGFLNALVKFKEEDIKHITSFNYIFKKTLGAGTLLKKDGFKKELDKYNNREIYWLTPMMAPMRIIVDKESRICFYHNPKGFKYRVSLEEILQFSKDVGE